MTGRATPQSIDVKPQFESLKIVFGLNKRRTHQQNIRSQNGRSNIINCRSSVQFSIALTISGRRTAENGGGGGKTAVLCPGDSGDIYLNTDKVSWGINQKEKLRIH